MLWSSSVPIPLEKTIVLILPAAGMDDETGLRASLVTPGRAVRVLLCVPEDTDSLLAASLARTLERIEVETQILLHSKAQGLGTGALELRAPTDMMRNEQIEFAFAFSDVVLIADASETELKEAADKFHKPTVQLGGRPPTLFRERSITNDLDPKQPGWFFDGRSTSFGRLEQAILELFAFGWLGWNREGFAESTKRLKRCFQRGWKADPYFAPDDWRDLALNRTALDESSPIVRDFEAMDRSALYGSYVYRDLIWVTHFLAAFAVLAAVAGALVDEKSRWVLFWGLSELVTLLFVLGLIFASRYFALRDRWTACRLGAEQLRIARMALPLLVAPRALSTLSTPVANGHDNRGMELDSRALEEVKRAVRDHGLPRGTDRLEPSEAARWVHCIVADQINYHHRNHAKLERVESWLTYCAQALFLIALIAVVRHLWSHEHGLLLFTAAGPAFAAALHGAGTRLGIVHRAALSGGIEKELRQIDSNLIKLINGTHSSKDPAAEVRALASAAAEAMGTENTSWHGLVRRYKEEV